jgi:hypothetical protein
MISFERVHKISTVLAVFSVILCSVLIFLAAADDVLRLNMLPQSIEDIVALGAWAFGPP